MARRLIAAGAVVALVLAGLGVHLLLPDTPATDIAGDALYAVAIYAMLVVVAPRLSSLVVGAIAAGWCVAVEVFQLTGIPLEVGAVFPPAMLVLGTVFDARDLVVYVCAVAVAAGIDTAVRRTAARRSSDTARSPDDSTRSSSD